MAEAAGIFVSHAHEDNAWCRIFVEALRQGGANVWYDEHNLGYGILGDEIETELRARDIFTVILSPASVSKPWVRREMNAAIHLRDQNPERIILPVVAKKTAIPLFWEEYKRVSGPGDRGIGAPEAAGQVIHTLGIVPATAPKALLPPHGAEMAEEATERGDGLFAQKRYEEALAAFEQALTLDSQLAIAWAGKGRALGSLKRYEEALAAFEQALTLDSQLAIAWAGKSISLGALNRPEESLLAIERALALDDQYVKAWTNKGRTLGRLKHYEEALAALERALTLDPTFDSAWDSKIAVLKLLGRLAEAQEAEQQRDEALGSI